MVFSFVPSLYAFEVKSFLNISHYTSISPLYNGCLLKSMQIILKILKYNDFFETGENRNYTKEFNLQCNLYLGGKNGDKLYYGKPVIYDDNRSHFMFPNEARLRNMTYGLSVHFDVDVDFKIKDETETIEHSITLVYLGNFPIMLMSN